MWPNCIWKTCVCIGNCIKKSAFNDNHHYIRNSDWINENISNKRKIKHNIIWYNPPNLTNKKINFRKTFFKILRKTFPNYHQFCMKNMETVIYSHKQLVLKPSVDTWGCNCGDRKSFLMDSKCKTPQTVYRIIPNIFYN